MAERIATVVIGRNEGVRLERCLASLAAEGLTPIVYVDSGSSDGSVATASAAGAEIVELDLSIPFTAARARNAGYALALKTDPKIELVQFIDGDCEMVEGWIDTASAALRAEPDLAVVCGRRRERFPEASLWNALTDAEWDTPVGETGACGGDALIRRAALEAVGGYREDLIAGEEPEMCYRMRLAGWRISRLDAEMTLHDAALTRWTQWWQRARRAGFAFAEGAALHYGGDEGYRVAETRRALLWGLLVPLVGLLSAFVSPWMLLFPPVIWAAQTLRLTLLGHQAWRAAFLTLGKIPEAQGVMDYWAGRLRGRRRGLIEYK